MKEENIKKNEENINLQIKEIKDKIKKAIKLIAQLSKNTNSEELVELARVHWIYTKGYSIKFDMNEYLDFIGIKDKTQAERIISGILKHERTLESLNRQLENKNFIIKIIKERDMTVNELNTCDAKSHKGKYIHINTEKLKDDYTSENKNIKVLYIYKSLYSKTNDTKRVWMIDSGSEYYFKPVAMGDKLEDKLIKEYILNKYK